MTASFYRAFEDRYRGSRELIKQRHEVYLPFIQPLKELYPECPVLDIGCGRGEWLELMIEKGFQARGIDLDEGMLESCHALDLPAEQGEALATLKALPENSQAVVSGFHIAEHIPFSVLYDIVVEVARVLKPAGLLILETPNAENIVVGTNNFYLDPTHERPIPHLLLDFLTEYSGFSRTKLLRLQENLEEDLASIGLKSVLAGVSQDYAVIAQKSGEAESLTLFESAFANEYGYSLDFLAQRYDARINEFINRFESKFNSDLGTDASIDESHQLLQASAVAMVGEVRSEVNSGLFIIQKQLDGLVENQNLLMSELMSNFKKKISELESELLATNSRNKYLEPLQKELVLQKEQNCLIQQRLDESLSNAHNWYLRAVDLQAQVEVLRKSTSWKFTAPLRQLSQSFSATNRLDVFSGAINPAKRFARPVIVKSMRLALSDPSAKRRIKKLLMRSPKVYTWLVNFGYRAGLVGNSGSAKSADIVPFNADSFIQGLESDNKGLSLSARIHYDRLKKAIQNVHEGAR